MQALAAHGAPVSGFAPIKMRNHSIVSMNSEDIAIEGDLGGLPTRANSRRSFA